MKNNRIFIAFFGSVFCFALLGISTITSGMNQQDPNIVFIMCDDLGYGEISALNVHPDKGRIETPNIDQLASEGMIFTDMHSGSSVCTPTRYGLLTGRYAWRTKLQSGVVQGHAPCLIDDQTLTIAEMLKKMGYHTGIVGKWHLNYIYTDPSSGEKLAEKYKIGPPVNCKIKDGPLDHGFDYFYGYHHSRDMQTVCENNQVIARKPTITMLPGIEAKAVDFINKHADAAKSGTPFFLYVPLSSPHSPVVPTEEWQNKSGLNEHADFVMQTDHTVGQIIRAIDNAGIRENTLIVFTSDNGTSGPTSNISELNQMGHYPSWILRGSKADIWDGGHRVPFIVRWPAVIEADSRSPELQCFTDFMPTVADIVGCKLPDEAAADGFSYKRTLQGKKQRKKRSAVIHHSIRGKFAIRKGKWKLVLCPGSGGWTAPKDSEAKENGLPDIQLYNMEADIGEQENLYTEYPDVVEELLIILNRIVDEGRSTRGRPLKNDIEEIDIWKGIAPVAFEE